VLATAGYDVARVMTWNFSNVPEIAPVAVHRHRPIVQDSTGRSMSKHPARLAHSRVGEIGCLINAAMVVLGSVGAVLPAWRVQEGTGDCPLGRASAG
jgi:hypothetical protein